MDTLISRQTEFIKLMLNEKEHKPIKYYTEKLNVSDKTLQKDLKIIGEYLSGFNISIQVKRGQGILIETDAKKNIDLINNLNINSKDVKAISVDQRRIEILKTLLLDSNHSTSINQLSDKYYVSKTSIVNDFKYVEEWLNEYNIKLSKTLEGTKIIGDEVNIRKSIARMLVDLLDSGDEKHSISEFTRLDSPTFSSLLKLFDIDSIVFVENIIAELEINLNYTISQPYYINLITHILICLKRVGEGNQIESQEDKIKNIDKLDEKVYENVLILADKIYERYGVSTSRDEIYYIYKYLVSSGFGSTLENNSSVKGCYVNKNEEVTNTMIDIMSEFLNINLKEDELLQKGLLLHIKPMLNRLKYDIQIKNPLLDEIQERFGEILGLCRLTKIIMDESYDIKNISIDEISYLATYFQAALERSMSSKRVLVVCHSGYGTSQLLATRLKKSFPQWTIVDIVPVHKLGGMDIDDIDFIILTVNIERNDKLHIVVSALLMESDINNIKNILMGKSFNVKDTNLSRLGSEMEGNIFINNSDSNVLKNINDKLEKNINFELVQLDNNFEIHIGLSSSLNKLITNVNNIDKNICFYLVCSDYKYMREKLIDIYRLYSSKKYLNYILECECENDIEIVLMDNMMEKAYEC